MSSRTPSDARCRNCWLSRFPTGKEDPDVIRQFDNPRLCDARTQIVEADNDATHCRHYISEIEALKRVRRGI